MECTRPVVHIEQLYVAGFKHFFHNIWDVILPVDELIFFSMFKTTNQYITIYDSTRSNQSAAEIHIQIRSLPSLGPASRHRHVPPRIGPP